MHLLPRKCLIDSRIFKQKGSWICLDQCLSYVDLKFESCKLPETWDVKLMYIQMMINTITYPLL